MIFEDFEGFKKIKNYKNLDLNEIYEKLLKYKNELGELKFDPEDPDSAIIVDVVGKYYISVYLKGKDIILERVLESGNEEDKPLEEDAAIELSQTDRMIEQIYDMLKDYIEHGDIKEHITSSQKTLIMKETEKSILSGKISMGKLFKFYNYKNEIVAEAQEKKMNSLYSIKDYASRREEWSVSYAQAKLNKFTILKQPFETIDITKDTKEVKTIFRGKFDGEELKISADYSDNHYLIESNEIVIGSIDCLDPLTRLEYRIDINNLRKEDLIIAIALVIDKYLEQ